MRVWGKLLTLAAAATFVVAADATPASAQTGIVTGTVVDATSGRSLESAQVFLPDLNMGGIANNQGRFLLLNIPAGTHELRVELIGYAEATQQVTVVTGETATVEFQLNATALRLQELVVTGVAGATPRIKLPFTVEKLDFEDMPVPASNVSGLIVGKVPGVEVMQGSGQPGSDSDFLLRGPTTITGSQDPLVIIDGVITDNTLADIASLDVESIEIVKGAAGASLYGSRAQNGVIQIRTRRGSGLRVDQSRISVRSEIGRNQIEGTGSLSQNHPWLTNAEGKLLADDGSIIDLSSGDKTPALNCPYANLSDCRGSQTAFQDEVWPSDLTIYDQVDRFFDPGLYLQQYAAVEGRTGQTNYRASFTYQDETGIIPDYNTGFQLKSFRLNLDHEVRDNLNVSLSTYWAQTDQEDLGAGSNPFYQLTFMGPHVDLLKRDPNTIKADAVGNIIGASSWCPVDESDIGTSLARYLERNSDNTNTGCLIQDPDPLSNQENPLYDMELTENQDDRNRFLGSASAVFSPTTWFELEGNFSLDRSDQFGFNIDPPGRDIGGGTPGLGDIFKSVSSGNDINSSLTASFNQSFGDLTTRTRIRYLYEDQHSEAFDAFGEEYAAIGVPDFSNIQGVISARSSLFDVISEGFFFISALDYQGKYIGDFLVRRDGSSLFGEDERWQTYFRAAGAWRLAQESWWPFDDINEFKLRYSIGTAGGRPNFSAQYETYNVSSGVITPTSLGNKLLKPELSTEQEMGLEMVLWNKISTGVTYAKNETEDQLLQIPLPGYAGFSSQWQNAGTIESNTIEAFAEMVLIERPDLGWSARVNFDRTRQEITDLGRAPYRTGYFYIREGEKLGTFYGRQWATSCANLDNEGVDCSQFDVNDQGEFVWVGAGNSWMDGISKQLWGSSSDDLGDNGTSYQWGIPIEGRGIDDNENVTNFLRIGDTTPTFNLSWSNTLRYKGFNFYMLWDGDFGSDIYNNTRQWAHRENRSADQDQAGKVEGAKKSVDYTKQHYFTNIANSFFVEDGTYIKLRELSLRYALDQSTVDNLFGSMGVDQLSINLIGRNIWTITDYLGFDPEVAGFGGGQAAGGSEAIGRVDTFDYPNYRTFTASIEVIF